MPMNHSLQYRDIFEVVLAWPVEDRIALAHDVLETLHGPAPIDRVLRPSFTRALGIAQGSGPPPTDEQVQEWIGEHRISKHG